MLAPGTPGIFSGRENGRIVLREISAYRLRSSATNTRSPGPPLNLSAHLTMERIKVPLDSLDKPGILRELCALLASSAGVESRQDEIHRAIMEREAVLSTGVGRGVALPHGKCSALNRLELVAGTTRVPVDFDSVDGEPVRLLVMMAGPATAAGYHVKTLGHISRALKEEGLRTGLCMAASADEFRRLLLDAGA